MALPNFIRGKKPFGFLLLAIALIFSSAYFLPSKLSLAGYLSFPSRIAGFITSEFRALIFFHNNYTENTRLANDNRALRQKLLAIQEALSENKRLRELLSLKKSSVFSLLSARVVGRDSANWVNSIIIDKGIKDGVSIGRLVITNFGLAGRVSEAGGHFSRVTLITDPDLNISGVIQRSREAGIVSGSLLGKCVMRYLADDADVEIGDSVLTLGLANRYPKGIIIGEVISLHKDTDGLSLLAVIRPKVRLSTLEEVFVVRK